MLIFGIVLTGFGFLGTCNFKSRAWPVWLAVLAVGLLTLLIQGGFVDALTNAHFDF